MTVDITYSMSLWPSLRKLPHEFQRSLGKFFLFPKINPNDTQESILFCNKSGEWYSYEANHQSQVSLGSDNDASSTPTLIPSLSGLNLTTILPFDEHIFALTHDDHLYLWDPSQPKPTLVHSNLVAIECTKTQLYALDHDAALMIFNSNASTDLETLKLAFKVKQVSCSPEACLVLSEEENKEEVEEEGKKSKKKEQREKEKEEKGDKKVVRKVYLLSGTLGELTAKNEPFEIKLPSTKVKVKAIQAGLSHLLVLDLEGQVYRVAVSADGEATIVSFTDLSMHEKAHHRKPQDCFEAIYHLHANNFALVSKGTCFIYLWFEGHVAIRTSMTSLIDLYALYAPERGTPQLLPQFHDGNATTDCHLPFNDPNKCDLVVWVKGRPVYVQRSLLVQHSLYFGSLLRSDADQVKEIQAEDEWYYSTYYFYLEYLHTNHLAVDWEIDLFTLARHHRNDQLARACRVQMLNSDHYNSLYYSYLRHYGQPNLKSLILELIKEVITVENLCQYYILAKETKDQDLMRFTLVRFKDIFWLVVGSHQFISMDPEEARDMTIDCFKLDATPPTPLTPVTNAT